VIETLGVVPLRVCHSPVVRWAYGRQSVGEVWGTKGERRRPALSRNPVIRNQPTSPLPAGVSHPTNTLHL